MPLRLNIVIASTRPGRVGPAVAVVCAAVGVTALAPAYGGAYTALGLPATASAHPSPIWVDGVIG